MGEVEGAIGRNLYLVSIAVDQDQCIAVIQSDDCAADIVGVGWFGRACHYDVGHIGIVHGTRLGLRYRADLCGGLTWNGHRIAVRS
ncbi:hypothetical protein D3C71_2093100 [compost metagenome]